MQELTNESHGDENYKDAEFYIGCEQHLVDAEVTAEAAEYAQDTINIASCDIYSGAGDKLFLTIEDNKDLRQMFFDWLNVGTPLCPKQKAFIEALEVRLAKEFDA